MTNSLVAPTTTYSSKYLYSLLLNSVELYVVQYYFISSWMREFLPLFFLFLNKMGLPHQYSNIVYSLFARPFSLLSTLPYCSSFSRLSSFAGTRQQRLNATTTLIHLVLASRNRINCNILESCLPTPFTETVSLTSWTGLLLILEMMIDLALNSYVFHHLRNRQALWNQLERWWKRKEFL